MTEAAVFDILKPIISEYLPEDVEADQIVPEADLTAELNINSAHLVDVVLDVEDKFEIELSNSDIEQLRTVSDAVRIILSRQNVQE
jgi:acyl carrier protein